MVEKGHKFCLYKMSQEDVLNILKELKREATTKEIREIAKSKYRERTLYLYVLNRLKKLEKNNKVKLTNGKWKLIK